MQEQKTNKESELTIEEIGGQASNKDADEIKREILRGGETGEKADEKDNAGSVDSDETPHGREETKNDLREKENVNG
jgi:hypothetical protein